MKRMKSGHLTDVLVHCYVLDSEEHTKEKNADKKHFICSNQLITVVG